MSRSCALRALAVLVALQPFGARAASLESQSRSCWANPTATCEYEPIVPVLSGPGTSTSILRTVGSGATILQGSAAMTVVDFDRFSATAGGSLDYTLGPPAHYSSMNWQSWGLAWARIRDTLTATGGTGAGKIRMQWRITGAHDLHNDAVDPVVIFAIKREVKLDFRCYINPNFDPDCGNPVLVWEQSGPLDELLTFDLPIVFGAPLSFAYWIELSATSGFLSNYCETECIVSFHGASTTEASAELVAVELYDGAANLLDPSGITSESGFRYDLVTAPEPSAAAAAAAILAALLARACAARPATLRRQLSL